MILTWVFHGEPDCTSKSVDYLQKPGVRIVGFRLTCRYTCPTHVKPKLRKILKNPQPCSKCESFNQVGWAWRSG